MESVDPEVAGQTRIHCQCHCRTTSFSLPLPSSSFPLKSALCHCESCRRTSGQIFATWAVIPAPLPTEVLETGNLVKYESSSKYQRWFCRRCGASVINVEKVAGDEEIEWEVGTGTLQIYSGDGGLDGKLNRVQLWVEDVRGDGGAASWVNGGKLEGMDRRWRGRDSKVVDDGMIKSLLNKPAKGPFEDGDDNGKTLHVHCHCHNVAFHISRPERSFNHGTGRFEANVDACTSCRTVSGFEITGWFTVPKDLIVPVHASELDTFLEDRTRIGHYQTSPDVSRYFCVGCGATVFYYKHGLDKIDVAVGLLESLNQGNAKGEGWLIWEEHPHCVLYQEDAVDEGFVRDLAEGMRWAESEHTG